MTNIISMHKNKLLISCAIASLILVSFVSAPHTVKASGYGYGNYSSVIPGRGYGYNTNTYGYGGRVPGLSAINAALGSNSNVNNSNSNSNSSSSFSSSNSSAVNNNSSSNVNNNVISIGAAPFIPAPTPTPVPNLSVSCAANPSTVNVGNSMNWTASVSGGNGSYSYSWSGDVSGNSQTVSNAYSTSGTKNAVVAVTSGNQTRTASCSGFVNQVVNPIILSCSANPSTVNVGDSITWIANVSGGNGGYTYSWSGDVNGSGQTVSNSYSTSGTKNASVTVTSGGQSQTASCSGYVNQNTINNNTLDGYCSATVSNNYNNNGYQTVTWTAYPTGGNGNYSYSWSGSNGLSGSGQTVTSTYYGNNYNNYNYNQGGTQTASVQIYSNGQTITRNCSTYINQTYIPPVNNYLSFSCYPSTTNVVTGQNVTWYSNITGGNGYYTYVWNSSDINGYNTPFGYNSSASLAYYTPGTKTATLTVTSNGQSQTQNCGSVYVNGIANGNITVTQNPIYPAPLSSAVYLSQVPYTGLTDITPKMWLFLGALSLWSAWVAYMILRKKAVAEMDEEVAAAPALTASVMSADETDAVALALEDEARKSNVVVSEGALTSIMAKAKAEKTIALHILNNVIAKAKSVAGENEWVALTEEKVNANS